jgi:hypothetical protein
VDRNAASDDSKRKLTMSSSLPPAAQASSDIISSEPPNDTGTGTTTASNVTSSGAPPLPMTISREELLELARAIKFAKPDASQKQVHEEISLELSQKESFEFLKNVTLNEVKKV